MTGHPEGLSQTRELLALADLVPPAAVLDLGAGAGGSVALLRELGFDAHAVDLVAADGVQIADLCALPFPDASFDACLAECSFSVCGDGRAAFREARRVLRPGGLLLLSDVYFDLEGAPPLSLGRPATLPGWIDEAAQNGFTVLETADKTAAWKQYFLDCVWRGTADALPAELRCQVGAGYFLMIGKKT